MGLSLLQESRIRLKIKNKTKFLIMLFFCIDMQSYAYCYF